MIGVTRALSILSILARHKRGCSFTTLRKECGDLPAPTLSRLLKALVREGAVEKDMVRGGYCLGPAMVTLARSIVGVRSADRVQPVLDALARRSGQSAAYFEEDEGDLVLVAKSEVAESFHYIPVLARTPRPARHAFGRTLLAWTDPARRAAILAAASDDAGDMAEGIEAIRAAGRFEGNDGTNNALFRVVAPVFGGSGGTLRGTLGVTLLDSDPPEPVREHIRDHVQWAADGATRAFDEGESDAQG